MSINNDSLLFVFFFFFFFKVLDEFSKQVDSIDWPSGSPETINYKALDIHLSKYQVSFLQCLSGAEYVSGN